jgi:hypothetical protein
MPRPAPVCSLPKLEVLPGVILTFELGDVPGAILPPELGAMSRVPPGLTVALLMPGPNPLETSGNHQQHDRHRATTMLLLKTINKFIDVSLLIFIVMVGLLSSHLRFSREQWLSENGFRFVVARKGRSYEEPFGSGARPVQGLRFFGPHAITWP